MPSSTSQCSASFGDLIREHEELKSRIDSEQDWWRAVREFGKPQFGEMSCRLACLRTRIAAHFAHEDLVAHRLVISGCLPKSADLHRNADEHCDLLVRLEAIIDKAAAAGGYTSWGELGLEFSEFIHDLEQHETSELELLRSLSQTPEAVPAQ